MVTRLLVVFVAWLRGSDPDVRQYEQRREAMAALGRASVVASPSVHPAVADFGRPGHTL